MTNARSLTLAGLLVGVIVLAAPLCVRADGDEGYLTGTITSPSGEKMAGVTVSARAEGESKTTSVFRFGELLFSSAAARQIPSLGAGGELSDGTGRGRTRRNAASGFRAEAAPGFRTTTVG
jgi:hypothetical protein